ncbi:(2Fe-2S)-binding protein [Calditrichota bacterium]
MKLKFFVNRQKVEIEVSPKKRLLDILRDDLGLIGTKEGCGKGECGACTVFLNGARVNSCLIPAFQLSESQIVTIEGLQKWSVYSEIEKSYIENGAVQCGFCMSGFVMSTVALLKEKETALSDNRVKIGIGGNICRCTGHTKIIDAVKELSTNKEIITKIQAEWKDVFAI